MNFTLWPNTGYASGPNLLQNGAAGTVFWGLSPVTPATAETIAGWESNAVASASGAYDYANLDGNYFGIAIPLALDSNLVFVIEGMFYEPVRTTIVLVVDGVAVQYALYMAVYPTFTDELTVTVSQ